MSQADPAHTPSRPAEPEAFARPEASLEPDALHPAADDFADDPPAGPDGLHDLVFRMEDAITQSLCLSDALLTLMEGRRGTLRVKPGTIYFLASAVQDRLSHLNAEWNRLFRLTGAL